MNSSGNWCIITTKARRQQHTFVLCKIERNLCETNALPVIPPMLRYLCKAQPRRALLGYPFRNTAAHTEATPTREGI